MNDAAHTLNLNAEGPTHWVAKTPQGPTFAGSTSLFPAGEGVIRGVTPSFDVDVFGKLYHLCAVVYALFPEEDHFVTQLYLPSDKCWVTYDDTKNNGEAKRGPSFDHEFYKGK